MNAKEYYGDYKANKTPTTNLNYIFYTFRPHINDHQLFEDFLNIILPMLEDYDKYAYVIEKDNTPNKHFHLILYGNFPDYDKFKQKFSGKKSGLTQFKKFLTRQTETELRVAEMGHKIKNNPKEPKNLKYYLGYINKEDDIQRKGSKGFSVDEILNSLKYYYSITKTEIKQESQEIGWTILKPTTIHTTIEEICKKKQIMIQDFSPVMLTQEKISFNSLTTRQIQISMEELVIHQNYKGYTHDFSNHRMIQELWSDDKSFVSTYEHSMLQQIYEKLGDQLDTELLVKFETFLHKFQN